MQSTVTNHTAPRTRTTASFAPSLARRFFSTVPPTYTNTDTSNSSKDNTQNENNNEAIENSNNSSNNNITEATSYKDVRLRELLVALHNYMSTRNTTNQVRERKGREERKRGERKEEEKQDEKRARKTKEHDNGSMEKDTKRA